MAWCDVRRQFGVCEPRKLIYLVVQRQRATTGDTGEGKDQLIALWTIIYQRQPPDADLKPGLFIRLADCGLPGSLATLDLTAWQVPYVGVAPVAEQDTSIAVIEERERAESAHSIDQPIHFARQIAPISTRLHRDEARIEALWLLTGAQSRQRLGDDAGLGPFELIGADEAPAYNARRVYQEDGGMRYVEALEAERVVDVIRLHHGAVAIAEHRERRGITRDEVRRVVGVLRVDGQDGGALIG